MLSQNSIPTTSAQAFSTKWLPYLLLVLTIGLGFLYAWTAAISHSMNADGISYLDMGDAYWRGDWEMAVDSVWSPLYAWVLGAAMRFLNPPMNLEFPLVHMVNFVIYLLAFACFLYFWRQVMRYHHKRAEPETATGVTPLPDWALLGLGYSIFIASSLVLIEIWSVTPDMLLSAFVYLAAAFVFKIRLGDIRWHIFILLGIVLGLSYLTKAIMFPVSFLFLGATLFAVGDKRRALPRVLASLIIFLLICAPYIAVLTASKGEFGATGAGTFTYAKHVNGIPFAHWQGEVPGNGTPLHPSRKILDTPPIYEFGTPIGGTYPIGYDPSYWNAGLKIHFDFQQQVGALLASLLVYYDVFLGLFGALVIGLIIMYLNSRISTWSLSGLISDWGLAFLALAILVFYAIVLVQGRYIGAFVVLLFATLIANLRLRDTRSIRSIAGALAVIAIVFILANVFVFSLSGYGDFTNAQNNKSSTNGQYGPPTWPGEVAEELHQLGIEEGDEVAVIGYGFDSFWARLARVKIIAELVENDASVLWLANGEGQAEVLQAFASTGAKAVVAENVPAYASLGDWHQVGNSNYYIRLLIE